MHILHSILDLPFPPMCRSCKQLIGRKNVFCPECLNTIKPIVSSKLSITKQHVMKLYAISAYQHPLKNLILQKKWSDRLASKQLAQLLVEKTYIKNMSIDYLVPIPLHWTRYARRGYNQAHEMAKEISHLLDIPVLNLLKRSKRTTFQSNLDATKRQLNVKDAFSINRQYQTSYKQLVSGKRIVFVDDLCTTGATLQNAAKQLIPAQPQEISAVVACRVI